MQGEIIVQNDMLDTDIVENDIFIYKNVEAAKQLKQMLGSQVENLAHF